MAGFLRTAPALQYTETMNSHPNDGLEAQWWETSLKTHRHWLLWYIFFFSPWIFKWCVSTANFFPWPPLTEHSNSLQWEDAWLVWSCHKHELYPKRDLSVSPCHAAARPRFGPRDFAKFSLALFIACGVLSSVSVLGTIKNTYIFKLLLLLLFLEAYFMFSFYFWMAH